jgi:hypothetical protein
MNMDQFSKWSMIRWALMLCIVPACAAESSSAWKGSYQPVSRVCEGSVLTIGESVLTYNTCKMTKTQVLRNSKNELSVQVDQDAKCGVAGWVITLRRGGGSDVEVSGYRSVEDSRAGLPGFECTYRRRTAPSPKKLK